MSYEDLIKLVDTLRKLGLSESDVKEIVKRVIEVRLDKKKEELREYGIEVE